jgi:hypothetical protein
LAISEGKDARVLLHCFAGCSVAEICAKMGIRVGDLMGAVRDTPDNRRALPIRHDLTTDQEHAANVVLLRLWACAVEVRVSPDHRRVVVSPRERVTESLLADLRANEVAVATVLAELDGTRLYRAGGA